MVLVGWALDVGALKSILPGWASAKPNTALAFILIGIALLLRRSTFLSHVARLCGFLAGLIGLLTLAEYAFGWDIGIDQWLFREPGGTVGTSNPGRMAPDTALCFIMLAAGMETARAVRQTVGTLVTSLSLGGLVTTAALSTILVYFTPSIGAFGWGGLTIMAVPTAAMFAVLGPTLILAQWQNRVSTWFLSGRITLTLTCGLALLVVVGLNTSRSVVRMAETDRRTAHFEQELHRTAHIFADVTSAQTNTRGYIITGEERFLQARLAADARCREDLVILKQLTSADSSHRQAQNARFEAQVNEALQWFPKVIQARNTGFSATTRVAMVNHGQDLIDNLGAAMDRTADEERQLSDGNLQRSKRAARFTQAVIFFGTIVSLIICLYAVRGLNFTLAQHKRDQEALEEVAADLTRSNKELEQFAYVASHDLQEPLRMVTSYTQLLAQHYEGHLDDKASKFMNYVINGAVRMQQLINDLLTYARVNTQGKTPEPTDSHSVLGEALRNLEGAIQESHAIVTNDDLPTVCVDAGQLLQVFQNLISNAIKFRGEDSPRVHVSARDLGEQWVFSLEDNGIGIESQYKDQVFVIFQRLHSRQEYPGTGIGLAVCKTIVERHGGKIWLESEPGRGSTFFFTVPKEETIELADTSVTSGWKAI
jgi:signal transduction histidine kinase